MIRLTWPIGQKVEIDGKEVVRIRKAIVAIDGPSGKSRVDWVQPDLFEEEAPQIADMVLAELGTLTSLAMPDGSPVWFNGRKASGPYYVAPTHRARGVNSSFEIGNKLQYVSNPAEEVAAAIQATGGKVLPIREDNTRTTAAPREIETLPSNIEVWDSTPSSTKEVPIS